MTRYEKSEYLTYASCQLAGVSNEDRLSAFISHSGVENISSFGVFDGHQGVRVG